MIAEDELIVMPSWYKTKVQAIYQKISMPSVHRPKYGHKLETASSPLDWLKDGFNAHIFLNILSLKRQRLQRIIWHFEQKYVPIFSWTKIWDGMEL